MRVTGKMGNPCLKDNSCTLYFGYFTVLLTALCPIAGWSCAYFWCPAQPNHGPAGMI
jgi:hypothetical protein